MDAVRVQVRDLACTQAARALLLRGRDVVCELPGPVDLALLDALARLRLLAGRLDRRLSVQAGDDGLLVLSGLLGVLRGCGDPLGQPEAGEQRRVEEVVDVDQLPG